MSVNSTTLTIYTEDVEYNIPDPIEVNSTHMAIQFYAGGCCFGVHLHTGTLEELQEAFPDAELSESNSFNYTTDQTIRIVDTSSFESVSFNGDDLLFS
jgi:hypothetical protein